MQPTQNVNPDYGFIMNNGQVPKKSLLPSGKSPLQRILIVVIGGFLLLLVGIVVFSLLSRGQTSSVDRLVGIVAKQEELARVAQIGEKQATSQDTKNLASTVSLSLISGQQQLLTVIKKQGRKITAKEITAAKNTDTDQELTAAAQANRFDEAFTATMQKQLLSYQQSLNEAYKASSSRSEKQTLLELYNQVRLLTKAE